VVAEKQLRKSLKTHLSLSKAKENDLPSILELQKRAYQIEAERYADPGLPPMLQTISDIQREFLEQTFFKAVYQGRIIASVRTKVENETCYINKLIVDPEYFRLGIAKTLMMHIETIASEVKRFELFTGHLSTPALGLYQSIGYREFQRKVFATHTLVFLRKQVDT
jgi:ribosomal protein S18 acetylase RimI-like enzyme